MSGIDPKWTLGYGGIMDKKFKKIIFVFSIICFVFFNSTIAWTCVNTGDADDIKIRLTYSPSEAMHEFHISLKKNSNQLYESRFIHYKSDKKTDFQKDRHNAVKELLTGEVDQAIEMFLRIEKKYPEKYSTASNLGTAYELNGNNSEALFWINKGIERHHNAHYGTEWLHAKILETKIQLEKDPEYLKQNRIVVPPTKNMLGTWDVGNLDKSLALIEIALVYQLKERLVFIKPQDPVVADLLFTYSWIVAERYENFEIALELLNWSSEYGFKDQVLLNNVSFHYNAEIFYQYLFTFCYVVFLLLLVYLTILFFKLDRNSKNTSS